ncbi:MAG TPA: hypothetical protein VN598_18855 [Usitatibacter sp.]|nr:hypothetical protein [Usitatibacter sp.]
MKTLIGAVALAALASAAQGATRDTAYSERGDPHRWYVPAETPKEKYANAAREARSALADALRECRASSQARRCEHEARARYRDEMAHAREFLAPSRQLA